MDKSAAWKHFLWGFLVGFFLLQTLNAFQDDPNSWMAYLSLFATIAFVVQMVVSTQRAK